MGVIRDARKYHGTIALVRFSAPFVQNGAKRGTSVRVKIGNLDSFLDRRNRGSLGWKSNEARFFRKKSHLSQIWGFGLFGIEVFGHLKKIEFLDFANNGLK